MINEKLKKGQTMKAKVFINGVYECDVDSVQINGEKCAFITRKFEPSKWTMGSVELEIDGGARHVFVFENLYANSNHMPRIVGRIT